MEHPATPPADKKSPEYNAWKAREWRRKNPEGAKAIDRRTYVKNRARILVYAKAYCPRWRAANRQRSRDSARARRHGITVAQLHGMYERQNSLCAICKQPEPANERFHVDHDHATGEIRELICRVHNTALQEGVTPEMLRATADYLERHSSSMAKTEAA